MTKSPLKLPDLHIEEARLGERVVDDTNRAAVEALAADDDAFLAAQPPAAMAATIAAAAAARSSSRSSASLLSTWRRVLAMAAVPTMAAAALAFAVLQPTSGGDDVEVITAKGGAPVLVATRVTSAGAEPLADGAVVGSGDVVQLGWVASSTSTATLHGVVVSIDGRGTVTRHLPLTATAEAPVLASKGVLPSSYELDDAPGFERFFLVTGDDVDVDVVMQAATRLARGEAAATAPLSLPAGLSVSVLSVRK